MVSAVINLNLVVTNRKTDGEISKLFAVVV
ncbi:hypothetical protein SASC598P14_007990 [Snodgrassella alvi SCGC AB-598-P14]|nr:hypothetical protein SASC598P14_007990 [Snodgrassella alvi SCGC AB-598-P14]